MPYYFTSESVSEGHPDKIADQISDSLLDAFLAQDPNAKVACETLVTTGLTVLSGEVKTQHYVDVQYVARNTIRNIGYTHSEYQFDADSCGVISSIHEQSPDISQGVERKTEDEQGAGDQGMMFGYATNESPNFMPLPLELAHTLLRVLAQIRREGKRMKYLRPDAKSQVTVKYNDRNRPIAIDTIVISTQHDDFIKPDLDPNKKYTAKQIAAAKEDAQIRMQERITKDIFRHLIPEVKNVFKDQPEIRRLFKRAVKYHINPTGVFIIGGPHGDTGLTGRKIIVDTYGGKGAHGGGAFSGKDPSKVDRSAAYASRHIAKNMVAAGVCDQVLVQVSYAIGVAEPISIHIDTYGTANVTNAKGRKMKDPEIAEIVHQVFPMRPSDIIKRLKLRQPMYTETAAYGHMGRQNEVVEKTIRWGDYPDCVTKHTVELFTWEKLDYVDKLKKAFKIKA